jgi:hypothetical protein
MTKRVVVGMLLAVVGGLAMLVAGMALFLVGCDVEKEAEEPDVTPTPAAEASPTPQATSTATPVNLDWEKAERAMEADRAKPRFRGELGDFVVVEPNTGSGYPCPEPYGPVVNPEQSELYFDLLGAMIDEVGSGSCQGVIFSITAGVADGTGGTFVGRGYFVGLPLEESFDAPAERLKLMTVADKPALAMLPIPDCIACLSEVVVIERFPTEATPGVTTWAHTDSLDKAIALVEQIIAAGQ